MAMDDTISYDPLNNVVIKTEDFLAIEDELEIKEEPTDFLDDASCWTSVGIEMVKVESPEARSPVDEITHAEGSYGAQNPPKEEISIDIDKEKLYKIVQRKANIFRTQEKREAEIRQKKELQCKLKVHEMNIQRLQKELKEERNKMQNTKVQLINLRQRMARQEPKIKIGESSFISLDSSHHIFQDEGKANTKFSPFFVVETKGPSKSNKKNQFQSRTLRSREKQGNQSLQLTNLNKSKINKSVVTQREDYNSSKKKGLNGTLKVSLLKGSIKKTSARVMEHKDRKWQSRLV